jgi:hypothetical protein
MRDVPSLDQSSPSNSAASYQLRAWEYHCWLETQIRAAGTLEAVEPGRPIDRTRVHAAISEGLGRLEATGQADFLGSRLKRWRFENFVKDRTIAWVEAVFPGTAETYYGGPAESLLWLSMSGHDRSYRAVGRLLSMTGLRLQDLRDLDTPFFTQLVELCPGLAPVALSAFISLFFGEYPELARRGGEPLWPFYPTVYYLLDKTSTGWSRVRPDGGDPPPSSTLRDHIRTLDLPDHFYRTAMALLNSAQNAALFEAFGIDSQELWSVWGEFRLGPVGDATGKSADLGQRSQRRGANLGEFERKTLHRALAREKDDLAPILIENDLKLQDSFRELGRLRTLGLGDLADMAERQALPIGWVAKYRWATAGSVF